MNINPIRPLIDVNTLKELFNSSKEVVLLDATIDKVDQHINPDGKAQRYIPGSRFMDIEREFSDHNNPLPHTLVDPQTFENEVRTLGVNTDSIVVIYDRWGIYSSPRGWWMFRYMGHRETYVLDGGLPAWVAAGMSTQSGYNENGRADGNFSATPQHGWFTNKSEMLRSLDLDIAILDARSAARFAGTAPEPRAGLRSGHMPGAKNLPFESLLDGINYKSRTELEQLIQPLIQNKPVIFTCGSGISAAILALATHELGHNNISIYDGSWSEWAADNEMPVVTGPCQ